MKCGEPLKDSTHFITLTFLKESNILFILGVDMGKKIRRQLGVFRNFLKIFRSFKNILGVFWNFKITLIVLELISSRNFQEFYKFLKVFRNFRNFYEFSGLSRNFQEFKFSRVLGITVVFAVSKANIYPSVKPIGLKNV
jgi:hypothetical protein